MKVFDLRCACSHIFEAWFPSSQAFTEQQRAGLVHCPLCGQTDVSKVPSPTRSNFGKTQAQLPATSSDTNTKQLQEKLKQLRAAIAAAEDVGAAFVDEARAIHRGDAPERGIRGTADLSSVQALREEGIDVLPLPQLPGLNQPLH